MFSKLPHTEKLKPSSETGFQGAPGSADEAMSLLRK